VASPALLPYWNRSLTLKDRILDKAKAALHEEDIANGVFIPVARQPIPEPKRGEKAV